MKASDEKIAVLFLCIGNSCRSPMAESIALRDYGELFAVSSAGISPLGVVQPLTLQTLRANGYPADGLESKSIRNEVWGQASVVINMSGYHRHRAFPQSEWHKIEDWEVQDPYGGSPEDYQRTFADIRSKIERLVERLRFERRKS
jgi:protein-tyrosine-phosphatase